MRSDVFLRRRVASAISWEKAQIRRHLFIEKPEGMRKLHLTDVPELIALAKMIRRRRAFAASVHGQNGGLLEGRGEERACRMSEMVRDEMPGEVADAGQGGALGDGSTGSLRMAAWLEFRLMMRPTASLVYFLWARRLDRELRLGGTSTPDRLAFERPMAMACFRDLTGCFPCFL